MKPFNDTSRSDNIENGFIFDWDGVVVDSSAQHEEIWERLAAREGLPLFEGHFLSSVLENETILLYRVF